MVAGTYKLVVHSSLFSHLWKEEWSCGSLGNVPYSSDGSVDGHLVEAEWRVLMLDYLQQAFAFGMCFRTDKSTEVWNYFIICILGWPAPLLRCCAVEMDCLAHKYFWISHLASACLVHGWIQAGGNVFTLEFGGQSLPNGRACTTKGMCWNVCKCVQMNANLQSTFPPPSFAEDISRYAKI